MRYDVNSYNTKLLLASTLKHLATTSKSTDKITIASITSSCKVHRNTFYYHFSDIKELILWTLHNDFYLGIKSFDQGEPDKIRSFTTEYLNDNRQFLLFSYDKLGYDQFTACFHEELDPIMSDYIDSISHLMATGVSDKFQAFLSEMFCEQIISIYLLQIRQPLRFKEPSIKPVLCTIFDYAVPQAVLHEKEIWES